MGAAKKSGLEEALKKIAAKHGDVIYQLGKRPAETVPCLPTGIPSLDMALGGGLPRKRISELFGREGGGKTSLMLQLVANTQANGGRCAYIDSEHSLNLEYAKTLGVDLKNLWVTQLQSAEETLDVILTLVKANAMDLIVVDSVASLVPNKELKPDSEIGEFGVGLLARIMSQGLRLICPELDKSDTALVFINQTRDLIGPQAGTTTPGGRALKFYTTIRLEVGRPKGSESPVIKGKDGLPCGIRVMFRAVKSKIAAPYQEAIVDLIYGRGFPVVRDLMNTAIEAGVITQAGPMYSYNGVSLAKGAANLEQVIANDKDLAAKIQADTLARSRLEPVKED